MQEYYLVHHGVKGMKWGVRKDRSSSGSSKVKKAIKSGATKAVSVAKGKIADKKEVSRANRLVKMASKDPSKLTESEMEYVNRRVKLENQVRANVESSKSDSNRPRNQREVNRELKKTAKNSGLLTDKEVNDRVARLQKEKQLRQLTDEMVSPGKTKVKQVLSEGGSIALKSAASKATTYAINKTLTAAGFPGVDFIAKVDSKKTQNKESEESKKKDTVVNVTGVWEEPNANQQKKSTKSNKKSTNKNSSSMAIAKR